MVVHVLAALVLSSNAGGKTLVRAQHGTTLPKPFVQPRTNYLSQPNKMNNGASALSPWTASAAVTDGAVWASTGNTTMTRVTNTSDASLSVYQQATVPAATQLTGSVWVAAASGSKDVTLVVRCPAGSTLSGVTCSRSDGGACTTSTGGVTYDMAAWAQVTTAQVKLRVSGTCSQSTTGPYIILYSSKVQGGAYSAGGVAEFAGARVEVGL